MQQKYFRYFQKGSARFCFCWAFISAVRPTASTIFIAIFHVLRGSTLNYWVRLPAGPEKAAKQSAGGARGTKRCDIEFLDRFCHKCHRCNRDCSKKFLLGVVNFVTNVTDVTRKFQRFSSLRGGSFSSWHKWHRCGERDSRIFQDGMLRQCWRNTFKIYIRKIYTFRKIRNT